MRFGWRDSAASAGVPDIPEADAEVDQEFEDACLALAMSDIPNDQAGQTVAPDLGAASVVGLGGTVDWFKVQSEVPAAHSFGAPTAAAFAEAEPEPESPAEITAQDLPTIPAATIPEVTHSEVAPTIPTIPAVAPPAPLAEVAPILTASARPELVRSEPIQSGWSADQEAELTATRAELTATKIELESLRADFQAERFRSRDERLRLEDELASRQDAQPAAVEVAAADEVAALHREVDVLRGELVALRSRHAEEVDRLEQDVKAAQAREAQTVIAAQLAEDELQAVRAESAAAQATAQEVAGVRAESNDLRLRIQDLEQQVRTLGSALDETEKDLRISRDTATDRIRRAESQLAAREAELAVTQQELLHAEERRAEEAASFLSALQKRS